MNVAQNKFLVGLGAAFGVGCLGLGWMVYQSYSAFDEANNQYGNLKDQLQQLQSLPLYPKEENLKKLVEQKSIATDSAIALHQKLVPMSFPLEPMTPEQFQNQLIAASKRLVDKAAANGVVLSDKLFLGFPEYKTATAKPEAVAALARQLKCIELAVDTLIGQKVASINKITRTPLPEEADASKAVAAPTPRGPAAKNAKAPLLSKFPFRIEVTADQKAFQAALNDLSANPKQFFIIQPLSIKSSGDKAPKKIDSAEKAAAAEPGATPKPEKMKYVLGSEKLTVDLQFNSVVFASNLPKD
jgi:hypothetical protein